MNEYASKHIKCFNPSADSISSDMRQRIYHYTSPQGLFELLKKATIQFTDCQFLNDKSEYNHIKIPLENAFKQIESSLHTGFENIIMDLLNDGFEADDFKATLKDSNLEIKSTKKRYFVFCASINQDSLGMWNYYVKDGNYQGYNLGCDVSKLLNCFSSIRNREVDVFYGKVLYRNNDKVNFLKGILLKNDKELKDKLSNTTSDEDRDIIEQEVIGGVINYLENVRLFFKDTSFRDEKEYRFVLKLPLGYIPNNDDPISIGFAVKSGVFSPFCELAISKSDTIASIKLSPMLEHELASQGLKRYLKHNGFDQDIAIKQSQIPIRY